MADAARQPEPPAGLFIVNGQGIRIPPGGLVVSIGADGAPAASIQRIEVALDMAAMWLRIALDQLDIAQAAKLRGIDASKINDDQALGSSLTQECNAGLLAIASSAFAVDALYATLKDRSPRVSKIPISVRHRGSTRYKLIAEALRREFRMDRNGLANVRTGLREVFKFRDMAVHPTGSFTAPVVKPEINKLTEWRFVSFGAQNAQLVVRLVLAILYQLADRPQNPSAELRIYLDGLRPVLHDLAARWRATYGILTDT